MFLLDTLGFLCPIDLVAVALRSVTTRTTLTAATLAETVALFLLHLLVLGELILGEDALDGVVLSLLALLKFGAEVLAAALRTLALLHLSPLFLLTLGVAEEVVVEGLVLLLVGLAGLLNTVGLALGHVLANAQVLMARAMIAKRIFFILLLI